MKNLMVIAIAVVLMAAGHSARAMVVIMDGTNTYKGICKSGSQLTIAYEVTEASGFYTYDYTLTTSPSVDLTSFTIGGISDPIDTQTMGNLVYGHAIPAASGFNKDSVGWDWGLNSRVTTDTVGFTSDISPKLASYTANDDDIEWTSPAFIPAPVPEPPAAALLAGASLVFGFFKYRRSAKLRF